ncbi:MAG TPA: ferritin-like domain-containing protein [Thermoleophilaceae bacterium]|nr:ferritin-like domain-containing protein [Thermoleophilaceae bacterium]
MPSSRRQLLLAGLALPLAAGTPTAAAAARGGDAGIVTAALDLERHAVTTYEQLLARGLIEPGLGERLRDHERRHVSGLERALEGMGRETPAGSGRPAQVPGLARALAGGRRAAVRFALELEGRLVAGYFAAQGELENPRLLLPLASIMASEGQHLALLRRELGLDPIPSAFERGTQR